VGLLLPILGGRIGFDERRQLITALEQARGGTSVIAYITSTRRGFEFGSMDVDTIPRLYRHLSALRAQRGRKPRIDLFIHSDGGDGMLPWRLVTLAREFASELTMLVPHHAYSAATLVALGCDRVIMHPMGVLGPIDPRVANEFNPVDSATGRPIGISVEDVQNYLALARDMGLKRESSQLQAFLALTDNVSPLALGFVKRSILDARSVGRNLLRLRAGGERVVKLSNAQIDALVRRLGERLYNHNHPIGRGEARQLGMKFVEDASPAVERAMWDLYQVYEHDMLLDEAWRPLAHAARRLPLPDAPASLAEVDRSTIERMHEVLSAEREWVECRQRSDRRRWNYEVTGWRNWTGEIQLEGNLAGDEWVDETADLSSPAGPGASDAA